MFHSPAGIILSTLSYCCCIDRRPLETFIFMSTIDLKEGFFFGKGYTKAEIGKKKQKYQKKL